MHLEIPDSVLVSSGQSRDEFIREARFLLALKLFELGRISSGQAAEMADMPRVDFLFQAGRMGVPVVNLDPEDLDQEFVDV